MQNSIRTTVVGSYPVPEWLRAFPNSVNLRDAVMVVMKSQELARLDVISDGELSRFDVNHPETNGMIDYFVRPLEGVSSTLSRAELEAFRQKSDFGFRSKPAGVVRSAIDEGELDLEAASKSVKTLTSVPLKFTVTSPYMLAKTLLDVGESQRLAIGIDILIVLDAHQLHQYGQACECLLPLGSGQGLDHHAPKTVVERAAAGGVVAAEADNDR